MGIDFFNTRTMLAALEQIYPPKTFLLDTFFKSVTTSITATVDIDITKGKRLLAPFVRMEEQGKVIDRVGYTTKTFNPPYLKMKMKTDAGQLLKRLAGNNIYVGSISPTQMAAEQLGKDLGRLTEMIVRREEWMAGQALTTGKIAIIGESINAEIDFGMDATHKPVAAIAWNQATSDPIRNLRDWSLLVAKDSGLLPDIAVFGSDVVPEFLNNDKIQRLLDNRRIDVGNLTSEEIPSGASFLGQLRIAGLSLKIFTYDEYYTDEAGDIQSMLPTKKVILGSTRARTARHYGAIQDLDFDGLVSVRWFPKSWREQDPSVQWLMVQSAPVVVPHQIDAFLCATVLP